MRIRELLEGFNFKEGDFVKQNNNNSELDYDLAEDLVHFMHNDDTAYRRHTYPAIMKCADSVKRKAPTSSKMFAEAMKECYRLYKKKFPIRILPEELDNDICEEACQKMHEEALEHISSGKYRD
jgi:DNA mismatch repair ATPase MutL